MRHSTWVKMHTNKLIVDAVNTEADRVAGREQVPEDSEPSTDLAGMGEEVIVNNEGDDGVEVGTGRNTAPDSEIVSEILGEEREASTDLGVVVEEDVETASEPVGIEIQVGDKGSGGQTVKLRRM
jgi:hypothetical protein